MVFQLSRINKVVEYVLTRPNREGEGGEGWLTDERGGSSCGGHYNENV